MRFKLLMRSDKIRLRDREQFLTRLAVLMKEGYLLPVALTLLLPMHTSKFEETLNGMTGILKGGGNAAEILKFLGFKDHVLFPVEIAEYHGRLPESIDSIAKSFARTEQVQKKLKNILIYPVSLLIFTSILFLFFRTSYVPNLTAMMKSLQSGDGETGIPAYLLSLPDFFIAFFAIAAFSIYVFRLLLKKQPVQRQINWLLAIPVIRSFVKLYWSHLLARELGTLLHSGISMQESLDLLQRQNYHKIIQFMTRLSHEELMMGQTFSVSLHRFSFVSKDMAAFVHHGEMTGYLGKELILYSEVLMERIELQTQQLLRIIQPSFFIMIAVCIVGAYLAILMPMYNLVHTI
ncbi:competence type IV pilus assembly protein ComGB [Planococcus kocurii]|uniref:Competence protein ComG n=2 Tax=Planococcus kocurii TaxID=1374 RepID=A0ABM5WWZ2_9BACL|nr:competence type IV pilus assembly protein ComGB [Planococcus sp. ANT_H30]ALS78860.1 competence protein ComG [Planococcus kocurii]KAA0957726.1 type II secretion system F family protein [Planococcus sp. ANT_H30]